jgi:hypothetical protein
VALSAGALLQLLASLLGATSSPWAYAGWLVLAFGALCLCDELGPSRPLNRAGLTMLAAAFCARSVMITIPIAAVLARAQLAYAFAILTAILFWSVALMHRRRHPYVAGSLGTALSGSALLMLLGAHLWVGAAGLLGFSELFAAVRDPTVQPLLATISVNVILSFWSLVVAPLLWRQNLATP